MDNAPAKVDRTGFIGGSDIAAIIGVSPWKDAFALYLEKRGELEQPDGETQAQRRGRILEPAIGALYAAEYGANVQPGVTVALREHDAFRAQIDFIEEVGEPKQIIPVEIKSASEFTRGKWGKSGTDDAPTYYCTQLHWQMIAAGASFGRIVALLGSDDLRVYTIERDEQIAKFLIEQAREFWQRVQDGNPPAVNYDHPRTGETLARLFNSPTATEILQADDALRAWRDVYAESGELVKRYEAARDAAKAHMLHRMGNAGVLDFGDGVQLERKIVKRKGFTVEPTQYIDARMKKTKAGFPALPEEIAA